MEKRDANDLLMEAIEQLDNVKPGETFIVRDLFQGIRWNRFERGERLLLGTLFLNYIKTQRPDIKPAGKNNVNQQKYMKIQLEKE